MAGCSCPGAHQVGLYRTQGAWHIVSMYCMEKTHFVRDWDGVHGWELVADVRSYAFARRVANQYLEDHINQEGSGVVPGVVEAYGEGVEAVPSHVPDPSLTEG